MLVTALPLRVMVVVESTVMVVNSVSVVVVVVEVIAVVGIVAVVLMVEETVVTIVLHGKMTIGQQRNLRQGRRNCNGRNSRQV